MIKRHINLLLLITAVFVSFTLGFFTGRNFNASPIQISNPVHRINEETSGSQLVLQAPQTEQTTIAASEDTAAPTETIPVPQETESPSETVAPTDPSQQVTEASEANAVTQKDPESTPAPTEPADTTEPIRETEETTPPATEAVKSGLININTASAAELMTLPGIGEVLSQRIVDYRNANGPFPSVAALTNESGIGEKRLAAIIHLITV